MRNGLWKLAGIALGVGSLLCLRIGLEFGWTVFQIARGNLGVAPGNWTEAIAPHWVVIVGAFLTILTLSIAFSLGWGARECFRPGGMFRWAPRKTRKIPWLSQLARERELRRSATAQERDHR